MEPSRKIQELLGQMQKTLECSICLEMMTNPVSTACGHQFCRFCLTEFLERKKQVPCPLCKKPITKRSLTGRTKLGDMVTGVRSLITAFQADTGAIFSPVRGPVTSLVPGTPEVIKSKANQRTRRSNVRRGTKRDSEQGEHNSSHRQDDTGRVAPLQPSDESKGGKITMTCRERKARQVTDTSAVRHADVSNTRLMSPSVHSENTNPEVACKLDTHSTDIAAKSTNVNIDHVNETGYDTSHSRVKGNVELEVNEQVLDERASCDNISNKSNDIMENNIQFSNETSSSSGPLFSTPLDVKSCRKSRAVEKEPLEVEKTRRSLRNKNVTDDMETESKCLTPEFVDHLEQQRDVHKTYSRRDIEVHKKEKKVTKKVSEWLKNVTNVSDALVNKTKAEHRLEEVNKVRAGSCPNDEFAKGRGKKLSKKVLKVKAEEELMGAKLKHLAKQVQDGNQGLLFEFDDFEENAGIKCDANHARNGLGEKDQDIVAPYESEETAAAAGVQINDVDVDIKGNVEDAANDENTDVEDVVDMNVKDDIVIQEVDEGEQDSNCVKPSTKHESKLPKREPEITEKADINNALPANKKRIFKTRIPLDNKTVETHTGMCDDAKESKRGDLLINVGKSQNENLVTEYSDPYEFRSSQPTPKKILSKKSKTKKARKKTTADKLKNPVIETGKLKNKDSGPNKIWNKELVPKKTILKNTENEIEHISSELSRAEDYDLLTSTQEVVAKMEQEKRESERCENSLEIVKVEGMKKKVRFMEPRMSDFNHNGHIDVIGFRKAKQAFEKEVGVVKADTQLKMGQKLSTDDNQKESSATCEAVEADDTVNPDEENNEALQQDVDSEPEQFEEPNPDLQQEDVKEKMKMQLSTDQTSVEQTPEIAQSQDSIVGETPALFAVPKFTMYKGKIVGKRSEKYKSSVPNASDKSCQEQSLEDKTALHDKVVESIAETPLIAVKLNMVPETPLSNEERNQENGDEKQEKNEIHEKNHQASNDESDETQTPDFDIESPLLKVRCMTDFKNEGNKKVSQITESQNSGKNNDSNSSEKQSIESQNSESILKPAVVATDEKLEYKDDTNQDYIMMDKGSCSNSLNASVSANLKAKTSKLKKKRKCFMLDDDESIVDKNLKSDDTIREEGNQQKRLRHENTKPFEDSFKRSHKSANKHNVSADKIDKEDVEVSSQTVHSGESSVDIIPDTISCASTFKSIDRQIEVEKNEFEMEIPDRSLDLSSLRSAEAIDVTPDLNVNAAAGDELDLNVSLDKKLDRHSSETKDWLLESEDVNSVMSTLDPQTVDFANKSEQVSDDKENVRKSSCEGKNEDASIQNDSLEDGKKNDVSRHLSGLLKSPNSSFVAYGSQQSPDDIFQMDTEMPTLDASPANDEIVELIYLSPDDTDKNGIKDHIERIVDIKRERKITTDNVGKCGDRMEMHKDDVVDSKPVDNRMVKKIDTMAYRKHSMGNSRKSSLSPTVVNVTSPSNSMKLLTPFKYKSPVVSFISPRTSLKKSIEPAIVEDTDVRIDSDISPRVAATSLRTPKRSSANKSSVLSSTRRTLQSPLTSGRNFTPNISKYSPSLRKGFGATGLKNGNLDSCKPEVVELKDDKLGNEDHYVNHTDKGNIETQDNDNEDVLLSPDDLPDLNIPSPRDSVRDISVALNLDSSDDEHIEDETIDNGDTHLEEFSLDDHHGEIEKKCKVTPDLKILSQDKEKNVLIQESNENFKDKDEEYDVEINDKNGYNNGNDEQVNNPKITKFSDRFVGLSAVSHEMNNEDENSLSSSTTSSEFKLDNSEEDSEEESPERKAINIISSFNKIKNCVEKGVNIADTKHSPMHSSVSKKNNCRQKSTIDKNLLSSKLDKHLPKAKKSPWADKYSSKLDSSDSELEESHVILESDVEDDDKSVEDDVDSTVNSKKRNDGNGKCLKRKRKVIDVSSDEDVVKNSPSNLSKKIHGNAQLKAHGSDCKAGQSDASDIETINDKQDDSEAGDLDNSNKVVMKESAGDRADTGAIDSNKGDNSDDEVVMSRKGTKRAILSDKDSSRYMNLTSSSAFSSQSENISTQDRIALEKDLERLAREREAIEKQLKRSKILKESRREGTSSAVNMEDLDDADIEVNISDEDEGHGDDLEMHMDMDLDVEVELDGDCQVLPAQESGKIQHSSEVLKSKDGKLDPGVKKNIGIVATGLNTSQVQEIKSLAAQNEAKFFSKFNTSVTHVIVKPAEEDDRLCERTLKFFQGLAHKCWILNYFWVTDSRQVGYLLPEGQYEIQGDTAHGHTHQGPQRSRLSKHNIFQNITCFLIGDNDFLTRDSLIELIVTCGGRVLTDPRDVRKGQGSKVVCVTCTDMEEDEDGSSLEQQEAVQMAKDLYRNDRLVTLTREWVLDSLTMFDLQPLKDYLSQQMIETTLVNLSYFLFMYNFLFNRPCCKFILINNNLGVIECY
ncbi:BRCA1-like protein [Mya arenaria]|uniref:RING-type E3 ubiquitin transferase BRCA1 n=1 Tax=Mya arenaria TaxID=6604 RepID=A0ABY7D741_MYAAR|nr:BRCA1-like protein [Mya arenaria]